MQAIKNSAHYRSELTGKNRGRGVAIGFWNAGAGAHSMNATLNADGTVTVNHGAVDIGGLRATEAMTFAEVLGIPYESVIPNIVDTNSIGWTSLTAGSGTGAGISASAYLVANQIKDRAVERAAKSGTDASACFTTARGRRSSARTARTGSRGDDLRAAGRPAAGSGLPLRSRRQLGRPGWPTYAGNIVDVEVDGTRAR
jgi:CO/xanthine dehydrogenase Mo-binding subunit